MRKTLILALAATAFLISACNTVSGVGRDVSKVGKVITGTADKNK